MGEAVGGIRNEMDAMRQQLADLQNQAGSMTGNLQEEMQQMREQINQLSSGLKNEVSAAMSGMNEQLRDRVGNLQDIQTQADSQRSVRNPQDTMADSDED